MQSELTFLALIFIVYNLWKYHSYSYKRLRSCKATCYQVHEHIYICRWVYITTWCRSTGISRDLKSLRSTIACDNHVLDLLISYYWRAVNVHVRDGLPIAAGCLSAKTRIRLDTLVYVKRVRVSGRNTHLATDQSTRKKCPFNYYCELV